MRARQGARVLSLGAYLSYVTKTARSATPYCDAYMRFKERRKGFKVESINLKAPVYQLKTISLFELIDTSTGINQLLLAREERMAIAANIHFHNVYPLRNTINRANKKEQAAR